MSDDDDELGPMVQLLGLMRLKSCQTMTVWLWRYLAEAVLAPYNTRF
jgi:hypothetical protein